MSITAVQSLFRYFLDKENNDIKDEDNNFDYCIKLEKEQMKSAFIAGIFARDLMKNDDFDLDKQFNKFYYKKFD